MLPNSHFMLYISRFKGQGLTRKYIFFFNKIYIFLLKSNFLIIIRFFITIILKVCLSKLLRHKILILPFKNYIRIHVILDKKETKNYY